MSLFHSTYSGNPHLKSLTFISVSLYPATDLVFLSSSNQLIYGDSYTDPYIDPYIDPYLDPYINN